MPEKKQRKGGSDTPKKSKKKKGGYPWVILGIAFLVLFSGIIYLSWERPAEERKAEVKVKEELEKPTIVPPPQEEPAKKIKPRIAIIIDDLGNSKEVDDEVLSIDAPLTVAVLPLLPGSKKTAESASSNGKEVMLHLPMEPLDYPQANPGQGALFTSMDDIAIVTQLYEDIKSVPGAVGVNNHMGSRFTEDRERMRIVLKQIKDHGLYFIDSKTSPKSRNGNMAREIGLKSASRDVFLDNGQDEDYIAGQIEELKSIARKKGSAIGIGHPHPETIAALRKAIPEMNNEFEIVPASKLVK
jgi:polysaccharide deacetylase 2 family uncharacterized protein YibQ